MLYSVATEPKNTHKQAINKGNAKAVYMVKKRPRIPLSVTHPNVASEWHPINNGSVTPDDIVAGSNKRFWWKCPNGPDHEWRTTVSHRSNGSGCPCCTGRQVSVSNSLAALFPDVAGQLHPALNNGGTPDQIVAGSHSIYWWKCTEGPDHEWRSTVNNRTNGRGCPYCSGRKASITNSLAVHYPNVASEWHPTKNGDTTPAQVASGTQRKAWWKCSKGPDHEWECPVYYRTTKSTEWQSGCPFCSGRKPSAGYCLLVIYPRLASEWHPSKNGSLKPDEVVPGSRQIIWWKCPKGPDHEWKTRVSHRTSTGTGCPYCAGMKLSVTNSLANLYPQIAAQLHPNLNGGVSATDIVAGGNKPLWWRCTEGPDHEWRSTVNNRTNGRGCPYCSGRKASVTNSLAAQTPDLAAEWHPTKNGGLTADDVTPGSGQKAWWLCAKDPSHEWRSQISSRGSNGVGCPACDGRQLTKTNSLAYLFPDVASQWHYDRNGELTPETVVAGSRKKVWWTCPEGPDHEWEATVTHRTSSNSGCPYCVGLKVSVTNSLATKNSEIAAQWHPSLNGDLTPDDVTFSSGKTAWWRCTEDPRHEWKSAIYNRTDGNGCPYCTLSPRSKQEIDLAFELLLFLNYDIDDHKETIEGRIYDCDIIIRGHRLIVEFDGAYWHKDRCNVDLAKTNVLSKNGWSVIRVREHPLPLISPMNVEVPMDLNVKAAADTVLLKIRETLNIPLVGIEEYLTMTEPQNKKASERYIRKILKAA